MRIASNTISDTMLRQIQQLTSDQANLQAQVATGRRITQPEDDPAAVGRVLILQSEQRELSQYGLNTTRALTLSQTSYAGLKALKKVSDRAGELATLGTGSLSTDAMSSYATETDQLLEQAVQLANTKSGNDYIYGGTRVDTPPFVITRDVNGKIDTVTYVGNAGQAPIQLSEATAVAPGTTGATNTGVAAFLSNLITLRNALSAGDVAAVSAVRTPLTASEDVLVDAMATAGGIQTRIEAAQAQQKEGVESLASLVSSESSVDLPTAIVKLNQTQTAYQAALASASKIMNLSLLDYIR
jgi:flagellar hook-associated protein 3 FlgL